MKCPQCGHHESRVVDSRPNNEFTQIRRRRECEGCSFRYTTYEVVDELPLVVVKKDGRREEFSRQKVVAGLLKACEKRPVALEILERLVDEIVVSLHATFGREVPVAAIGDLLLPRLLDLDKIAYVRFLSVYRDFQDPRDFIVQLEPLLREES